MKISQIIVETATTAGSVATVSKPLGEVEKRQQPITVQPNKTKKKGPYANSIAEGKKVDEAKLDEEDKIIAVGKGKKLKTGLHGRDEQPKFRGFTPPFKSEGMHVSDKRGNSVCECGDHLMAPIIAKALNAYASTNESIDIEGAGVVAGGAQYEGKKVDRMVKHIEKSERKLGKTKDEAENIAWATANKRGMLDNKNKKK